MGTQGHMKPHACIAITQVLSCDFLDTAHGKILDSYKTDYTKYLEGQNWQTAFYLPNLPIFYHSKTLPCTVYYLVYGIGP